MILLLCVVWHRIESPFAHVCFVLFFFKSLINFSWSRAGQPMAVSRKKPRSIVRMAQSVQDQQTNDYINQLRGGIYHKLSASLLVCAHSAPHEVAGSNPRIASFLFLPPAYDLLRTRSPPGPTCQVGGLVGAAGPTRQISRVGPTHHWKHVGGAGPTRWDRPHMSMGACGWCWSHGFHLSIANKIKWLIVTCNWDDT